MKEKMIYTTCPHCGHVFQIKRDTFSIAGMNSMIDQRLKEGTYFTHICQKCKQPFYSFHPFLYRDPVLKYILILSQQKSFESLPEDEKIIVCKNVNQFLFSYKVLSQQLNLKFIFEKKKTLENRIHHPVKFDSYDSINQCLWFYKNQQPIALKLKEVEIEKVYDRINTL